MSQSSTKYLLDSVLDYVRKEQVSYAIMINGEWGSGKTYYWNNVLTPEIEKMFRGENAIKPIYISLYGVSSTDEISKKIFLEVYTSSLKKMGNLKKLMESKVGGAFPEISKVLLDFGGPLIGVDPTGSSKVDWSKFYSLTNKVLCFDDLERANLDVTEILGYINNFIEHDKIKTIILCNEIEIYSKKYTENSELKQLTALYMLSLEGGFQQKSAVKKRESDEAETVEANNEKVEEKIELLFSRNSDYGATKEKVVGKTLLYRPNDNEIIGSIINMRTDSTSYVYVLRNCNLIIDIFKRSNTNNMRILIQALDDFERIYDKVTTLYPKIDEIIIKSVLVATLSLSFELKSGKIVSKELKEINSDLEFQQRVIMDNFYKTNSNFTKLKVKYGSPFNPEGLTYYAFAKELIIDGILRENVLKQEIDKQTEYLKNKEAPAHIKIFKDGFWELSDEEFRNSINQTYQTVLSGDMYIGFYYSGFIMFLEMMKRGLIDETVDSLIELFSKGLEKAKDHSKPSDLQMSFMHKSYQKEFKDAVDVIKQKVIEVNRYLKMNVEKEQADALLKILQSDVSEFHQVIDKEYYSIPFLTYLDMDKVFNSLKIKSNKDIHLFTLILRERFIPPSENLKVELYKLIELKEHINNYLSDFEGASPVSVSYSNYKTLITLIDTVLNDYKEIE